ncbi:LEAF RUST 10 DISEASE-RESISTANCE LOCUS RECEPTOR-LIKE PROTEIN KINASE-like 2.3 [Salvia splendens]|uniref:LEAF RUST 10 DISEASE-RESISTANCE LOCUS RECEPTOR-LIKE PROTEIN KINASE-like 2.3 n=1 Tax=Salvia splendens TaxID=180675 RepID=UPI001C25537B|nr:LEAF RUST 10 DISEASE-RESISTANCE LOCUS RECEPTOR-LIKE PROTEIN KINASE-like 2.3 [Salvia splendens]
MIIVALWCILMSPDDRPSMNKVLEMLEGDVERLQIPSQSTQIGVGFDQIEITSSSDSVSLFNNEDASICVQTHCTPSSCGIIPSISKPFRLKGDPKNCGDPSFELRCENNVTSITLNSQNYYVKAINYHNSTITLVDPSIVKNDMCSFPTVSSYAFAFIFDIPNPIPYRIPTTQNPINFFSCPHQLKNSSLFTDVTTHCAPSSHLPNYAYIKVGHLNASEVPHLCTLDLVVMTSWPEFKDFDNVSLSEIHQSLLYGFELVFCPKCKTLTTGFIEAIFFSMRLVLIIIVGLLCAVVSPPMFTIFGFAAVSMLLYYIPAFIINMIQPGGTENYNYQLPALILSIIIGASRVITFPLVAGLLIYKFRTRRLSLHEDIESFLQSDNKLAPIRYSYPDVKKMTKGFQDKLGQGGYGSVYKGRLRSGHDVAVKLLGKSGGKGQDFMNEIATIGRIHHVNVVKLVGYCAHGSKLAIVFDFMTNGSLEKYLFNRDNMKRLNWDTKFEIAVGVARGIEYLHRGCDIQILHFDIKPHNILLDDKFIPKISDFGLAKFCSTGKNAVSFTTARGTIGYVAPELINRSVGAVSFKADVYSFGMLLIDMVGLKRDLRGKNGNSSKYFPYWIYDCFEQGKDIGIEEAESDDENQSSKSIVRKMAIVALWCILMSPDDRPSMNKVLEMLEGDVEHLQIPSQSTHIGVGFDQTEITCSSDSVSLLQHVEASICAET